MSPIRISAAPTPAYRSVMIFIDGGYLREVLRKIYGTDRIDFSFLSDILMQSIRRERIVGELIRVYYYDAIVDPRESPDTHKEQDDYFQIIRECPFHEVKLGRLVKTGEGYRQKGVDVLIAVDMITKAFQNHYDIAIFLGGDDDFVDLIRSVKDLAGKRVYGVFYPDNVSKKLVDIFDFRLNLTEDFLKPYSSKLIIPPPWVQKPSE